MASGGPTELGRCGSEVSHEGMLAQFEKRESNTTHLFFNSRRPITIALAPNKLPTPTITALPSFNLPHLPNNFLVSASLIAAFSRCLAFTINRSFVRRISARV